MGSRTLRDPVVVWAKFPLALVDTIDHLAIDLHLPRSEVLALLVAEALAERRTKKQRDGG